MVVPVSGSRHRVRQLVESARRVIGVPPSELAQKVALRLYAATNAASLQFPLLPGDIADSTALVEPDPPQRPVQQGEPLRVGWVTTPPSAGSGGHTTLFRVVEAMERRGHHCVLFLYDRYKGDTASQAAVIREHWPALRCDIRDARVGMDGVDALVATSWGTAHALATSRSSGRRCYFVQDFEPFFYPRGGEYELARDTYRFGFRCIALGEMVAELLREEVGIEPDTVPFSCDTETYHLLPQGVARRGVVFYARPGTARRGYQLGKLALEEFHQLEPDVPIHVFGAAHHDLAVPATNHGVIAPAQLNELYNRVVAGLGFSFTNVSLVAAEMLAAGAVPVINDSRYAQLDLPSDAVAWTTPTPRALARRLQELVRADDVESRAQAAAADMAGMSWAATADAVCAILEREAWAS